MMRRSHTLVSHATVIVAATCLATAVHGSEEGSVLERADAAFAAGRLGEAKDGYRAFLAQGGREPRAVLQAGKLALWRGELDEAREALGEALALVGDGQRDEVRELLLQTAYRSLDFTEASRRAGELDRPARERQLLHLSEGSPYSVSGAGDPAVLPFVQTDPLPLVELSVNDSAPALFLVDTGGGELILDPVFAETIGALGFGSRTGTFAADQQAEVELAAVESVALGGLRVRDVPARLLPTGRFSAVAGGREVSGILGTLLLSRFDFTLDYPAGRLLLWRRGARPETDDGERLAYWLADDHLILAEGEVNDAGSTLMLIDTGLAGGAFAAPAATLARAGISTTDAGAVEGEGGGGRVRAVPVVADRLRLGRVEARDVAGFAGVFPESLEHRLGCRIGGLVSHGFLRPYEVAFDVERSEIRLRLPSDPE